MSIDTPPQLAGRLRARTAFALAAALAAASAGAGEFDCLVEPRQVIDINGPIEALISAIKVDRGDRIAKGDVLVEFDSGLERATLDLSRYRAEMQGAIEASQARYEHARVRHKRRAELSDKDFVSRQDFEDSEAELATRTAELRESRDDQRLAELEAERAAQALRLRSLVSPIDGIVVERLMHPGEVSQLGANAILRIAQVDVLNVEAILPAAVYRQVQRGATATVRPEVPVGGEYTATVEIVDLVVDAASGTFGVRLQLPNADLAIPAGFRCRVELPGVDAASP